MQTPLLTLPSSTQVGPSPRPRQLAGVAAREESRAGLGRSEALSPRPPARDRAWRDRVISGWLEAADRLAELKPRWRPRYEALVAAVCARLQRYSTIDLLITCYFQSTDFAAEAIQERYPNLPQAWDLRLIEDAAWGRRAREIAGPEESDQATGATPAFSEASEAATQGSRCLAAEDWLGARQAFQAAATKSPKVARYWHDLGIACGRLGDWRWAQDALDRANRLNPTGETRALLGEVRTIRRIVRQLRDRPSDAALHLRVGTLVMAWEHGDLALAHLKRAVDLAPAWPTPRVHLGLEYHYREEWEAADACYRAARDLGSDEASLDLLIAACEARELPADGPIP